MKLTISGNRGEIYKQALKMYTIHCLQRRDEVVDPEAKERFEQKYRDTMDEYDTVEEIMLAE